jgi:hypothetical protein
VQAILDISIKQNSIIEKRLNLSIMIHLSRTQLRAELLSKIRLLDDLAHEFASTIDADIAGKVQHLC